MLKQIGYLLLNKSNITKDFVKITYVHLLYVILTNDIHEINKKNTHIIGCYNEIPGNKRSDPK